MRIMLGRHSLGLYEKAMPQELDWEARLEAAKELGFDFVEISIDETDERLGRLYWTEGEMKRLQAAVQQAGIPIGSMCLSGHRRFPFGSSAPAVREKAFEIMRRAIIFAKYLGIPVIQLAGYDVYYEPSTPESVQRYAEGMAQACHLAEQYQIMLAVEIMDTEFMSSITRYKKWKELLRSPWFTVYPDLGNLSAWGNDTLAELALGQGEIVAIHLKDTLAVTKDYSSHFV